MRLMHISDLHLGKRVNEFSMIADQRYILNQILTMIDDEQPDGVLIAGDVYDRSAPAEEAVRLLDHFLRELAARKCECYIVSGNHDSAVRLSFGSELIRGSGIHIAPVYDGTLSPHFLEKDGLRAAIWLLPFVKPAHVRAAFPDEAEDIVTYTDACACAIRHMQPAKADVRILVSHQFVTGAVRSESEELVVGGLDNVDAAVFEPFDYVALGHIHGAQHVGKENVRYSGTPLKYSFSEEKQVKSVTMIDIDRSGGQHIRTLPLTPLHDLRTVRGDFAELTDRRLYIDTQTDDYIHAVLTDEEDIPDAMSRLRVIYPNLMKLTYDNARTREQRVIEASADTGSRQPSELFAEFYELQNNQPMNEEQQELIRRLTVRVWEGSDV